MTNEDFKSLLKKAGLSKKKLADILGISYNTVNGWGVVKDKPFPYWLESWLHNYIKANTLESAFNSVKDVICTNKGSTNE